MFVCVAGKNDIAVDVLLHLMENYPDVELGVVCNKTETGKNTWQKSLRWYAQRFNIREYSLEELYPKQDLTVLSLEFDRILHPELFTSARLFNIHFSLLPAYKGMYTSALPILNGEKEAGVTLHRVDAGIDTGPIIAQKVFPVENKTARDMYACFIRLGTELVLAHLREILEGKEKAYPQPAEGSTYYSKKSIDYKNLVIDLNQTAENIARQIRAFSFREYQLPQIHGRNIIAARITKIRSLTKAGVELMADESGMMLSTIDYNLVVLFDRFAELLEMCRQGDLAKVQSICAVPEHINARDEHGWSPLIVATYYGHVDVAKWLILNGADIHAVNNNGTNLLMYAKDAALHYGDNELFRLYMDLGLKPTQQDHYGHDLVYYLEKDGYTIDKFMNT